MIPLDSNAPEAPSEAKCAACGTRLSVSGAPCPACGRVGMPAGDVALPEPDPMRPFSDSSAALPKPGAETVVLQPSGRGAGGQAGDPAASSAPAAKRDSVRLHGRFGDYDILEEVARGGMGLVYRARHRTLGRMVALKLLRAGEGATEEDVLRFMREAKSVAGLSHTNIVRIYELAEFRGQHFFTMDFIEGSPLDRMLDGGPISAFRACELLERISRAIDYAHRHGIIHRDIKPANIIVNTEGEPIVTDFGLAVNLTNDSTRGRMTRAGAIMGTIPYIPPEQASGDVEHIDARSDVYSLGAVLYEMLTGRPPFLGETQYELLKRIIQHDPQPLRRLNPRVHPDAETICLKCLEKDPRRRYQTAAELGEDCSAFLRGNVIKARPATLGYRMRRAVSRYPQITALSLLSLVLFVAFAGYISRSRHKESQIRERMMQIEVARRQVEKEKQAKDMELQRAWRPEFSSEFDQSFVCSVSLQSAIAKQVAWIDPQRAEILPRDNLLLLQGLRSDEAVRGLFGIPGRFPFDFRMSLHIRIPEKNPGALLILLNTNSAYQAIDTTLMLRIGSGASPGASFVKGGVTLAENASFAFAAGKEYAVEVVRTLEDNRVRLLVDGQAVLEHFLASSAGSVDPMALALAARDGMLYVDRTQLSVLGLSRSMCTSLLEFGDTLLVQREPETAMHLFRRVSLENATRPLRIRALAGLARAISQTRSARVIPEECSALIEMIRQNRGRVVENGEDAYLTGLALSFAASPAAASYFQTAQRQATPGPDACLTLENALLAYPVTLEAAAELALSPRNNGLISWVNAPVRKDVLGGIELTLPGSAGTAAAFVQLQYLCAQPSTVDFGVESSVSAAWVNGEPLTVSTGQTVTTELVSGRNTLLLRIPLAEQERTVRIRTGLRHLPATLVGVYGHLARLESVLSLFSQNAIRDGLQELTRMHRDDTIEVLASQYGEELVGRGLLQEALLMLDNLMYRGEATTVSWSLLETLHALFPQGGRELSQRYYRLGQTEAAAGMITSARAAYHQAIRLAPDWHLPRLDLAFLQYALGDTQAGAEELRKTAELLPDSLELHLTIARFYLGWLDNRTPDPERALEAAHNALRISEGRNPLAWDLCACAYALQRKRGQALEAIEKALALEYTQQRRDLFDTLSPQNKEMANLSVK